MTGTQKWLVFGVAFFLVTSGAFYAALADHGEHRQKRWYQKIFDWDDDDDTHDRGKKRGGIKKFTGTTPSIMGNAI